MRRVARPSPTRTRRGGLLALALLLTTALVLAAWPRPVKPPAHRPPPSRTHVREPSSPTFSYGISSDYLDSAGTPAGRLFAATLLKAGGHVRISVPYDAVAFWNGSACAPSPAYNAGASALASLQSKLLQAHADGLVVEVVFTQGTGVGTAPRTPDPSDPAQASDYACGVRALMEVLSGSGSQAPVLEYEAWNEPENDGYAYQWDGHCAAPAQSSPSCSGPWRAAMLWYIAQTQANYLRSSAAPGFPALTVAALTMAAPEKLYFLDAGHVALDDPSGRPYNGYYQSLYRIVHCATGYGGCRQAPYDPTAMPSTWAVHDYNDPTAMGTADLQDFEAQLAALNDAYAAGAGAQLWVTESGVQLDSSTKADVNLPDGVSCQGDAVRRADSDMFGCLQTGNASHQAAGALAWKHLRTISQRTANGEITLTRLYWYQFALAALRCDAQAPCELGGGTVELAGQLLPALHAWDSALVDHLGQARASFCVLSGAPPSACDGDPRDYATAQWYDWWRAEQMPARCPAHFGAWVADTDLSGVPHEEECYFSPTPAPLGADAQSSGPAHGVGARRAASRRPR